MPLPQDRLTKLIHEDELEQQLTYEMERARRYAWDLGLVLVEPVLPEGSADMMYPALKRLAGACSSVMRVVDRGIRWGSGIFYILPETPTEGVAVASGKIEEQFASTEILHPMTGEPFKCGLRKAVYVYNGAKAKEDPASELGHKQIMMKLKEDLKAV